MIHEAFVAGARPSRLWASAWAYPGQVADSSQGQHIGQQLFTLPFTPQVSLGTVGTSRPNNTPLAGQSDQQSTLKRVRSRLPQFGAYLRPLTSGNVY